MTIIFLRRRKLGKGSCKGIQDNLYSMYNRHVSVKRNDRDVVTEEIVVRWGCTSPIDTDGIVINAVEQIHRVNNKLEARRKLQLEGVSVPRSAFSKQWAQFMLNEGKSVLGRPATHSQGRYAIRSCDSEDLEQDTTSEYWSEYLPKQKEYRVYCFFGRVVAVAEKIPINPNAIVWNHHGGGSSFVNVKWGDWPLDVCMEALKAQDVMKIDFTGVDVMVYNDKPYVLELNSAPSLSSPYRKQVFAKAFEYTFRQIEEFGLCKHFPLPEVVTGYRDIIHPFIS